MFERQDDNFHHLWLASTASPSHCSAHLPSTDAWERIAPAIPDVLKALGGGVYEAKWWTPVPMEDVDMLLRTEGIFIIGQPYEPADLTNGCAVRFMFQTRLPPDTGRCLSMRYDR